IFGRWGGEEFIALLPDTDLNGAVAAAERMRQAVEALSMMVSDDQPVRPTVSVGLAICEVDDTSLEPLFSRCDAALYEAKHNGRNRVCIGTVPVKPINTASSQEPASNLPEPLHPLPVGV
ncbi:MAG: GGDEF domain-containing protein, partial [Rhizobacter sp.]